MRSASGGTRSGPLVHARVLLVPRIVLICTNSIRRSRALSSSQPSLTASHARRVVSLSVSGRGSEKSRSHTARVSLTVGGTTVCGSGGEGGRDGGWWTRWWELEVKLHRWGRGWCSAHSMTLLSVYAKVRDLASMAASGVKVSREQGPRVRAKPQKSPTMQDETG